MPKQQAGPKRRAPARRDGIPPAARRETDSRVEELKLKLAALVDRHFEQSLNIIKRWMRDAGNGTGGKRD